MEVRPGYKQGNETSLPTGWKAIDLTALCDLERGFDLTEARSVPGDIPVYSSSGLSYYHDVPKAYPPGVVTGRKGSLGVVYAVSRPFWPHDTTLWVTSFRGNHPGFVALVLANAHLERFDAATSVPTLNRNSLRGNCVRIPADKREQGAIARAVEDAEQVIESVVHLLAKKRQVKQGAMQELLTGKRRLPGFTDRWEFAPLSALADIRNGGTPSTTQPGFWNGDIPWCTPSDITALKGRKYLSATGRQITGDGLAASAADILPSGSIVMTSRATIGECAINTVPMTTNQGFKNFVPASGVDAEFLYYRLVAEKPRFIALSGGSTFLEIGKSELTRVEVEIPPTTAEQRAIASVLSDMDGEIEALEAKLEKARQIKQGMMQELLTGRIRLV